MIEEKSKYVQEKKKLLFLKRLISVFAIVFLLLVLPVVVNLALSSQDVRNHAQVISSDGASDVRVDNYNNTGNLTSKTSSTSDQGIGGFFTKIYPFLIGLLIIIWGAVIFVYLGLKFRRKK